MTAAAGDICRDARYLEPVALLDQLQRVLVEIMLNIIVLLTHHVDVTLHVSYFMLTFAAGCIQTRMKHEQLPCNKVPMHAPAFCNAHIHQLCALHKDAVKRVN